MKVFSVFLILLQISFLISSCGGDQGSNHLNALNTDSLTPVLYWGSCDNGSDASEVQHNDKAGKFHILEFKKTTCREWYGEFFSNINLQMTCKSLFNGVFTRDYCEQANAMGICIVRIDEDSESRIYYDKDLWSADSAEKHCSGYGPHSQWSMFKDETKSNN